MLDDLHRDRVGVRIALELDEQALLDRTGGHAGRIEGLHERQDLLDFFGRDPAAVGDLTHLGPQVPVLVEVADDLVADAADRLVLDGEAELLVEIIGERRDRPHHVLEGQLVPVFLGHQ